jgi:hypothetical protein
MSIPSKDSDCQRCPRPVAWKIHFPTATVHLFADIYASDRLAKASALAEVCGEKDGGGTGRGLPTDR